MIFFGATGQGELSGMSDSRTGSRDVRMETTETSLQEPLGRGLLPEGAFREEVRKEQLRTIRSGVPFCVTLFAIPTRADAVVLHQCLKRLNSICDRTLRASDTRGVLRVNGRIGIAVLLHSAVPASTERVLSTVLDSYRKQDASASATPVLPVEPATWEYPNRENPADTGGPSPLFPPSSSNPHWMDVLECTALPLPWWKRLIDIVVSVMGLVLLSPLLIVIGAAIVAVSPGSPFFTQVRIGFRGRPFQCHKFRTMHLNTDCGVHKEYLQRLICEGRDDGQGDSQAPMIKLEQRASLIPFGHFLRKSCLDELPQLLNVLFGEMSLVGPRPAIPYEVSEYHLWHKGRFDTVPGMTGLWQVSGKNRLTFRQMARLDIQYARNRSFVLDMKILMRTPFVVLQELLGPASRLGEKGEEER